MVGLDYGQVGRELPGTGADQVGLKLERMAQNPKGLQLRELVGRLRPRIEAAQAAGYSLEDIVGVFQTEEVSMTVSTLKTYLREAKRDERDSVNGLGEDDIDLATPIAQAKPTDAERTTGGKKQAAPTQLKPDLTNTNEAGFQVMRSDDEL